MAGMARRIGLRDEAAEGGSEHDRLLDAERVAQRFQIVAPLRQRPAFARTVLAAPTAAMVVVDDLADVAELRERWLVNAVVRAGAAMDEDQCRLATHDGAVGNQGRALDVDKEANAVDVNMHR